MTSRWNGPAARRRPRPAPARSRPMTATRSPSRPASDARSRPAAGIQYRRPACRRRPGRSATWNPGTRSTLDHGIGTVVTIAPLRPSSPVTGGAWQGVLEGWDGSLRARCHRRAIRHLAAGRLRPGAPARDGHVGERLTADPTMGAGESRDARGRKQSQTAISTPRGAQMSTDSPRSAASSPTSPSGGQPEVTPLAGTTASGLPYPSDTDAVMLGRPRTSRRWPTRSIADSGSSPLSIDRPASPPIHRRPPITVAIAGLAVGRLLFLDRRAARRAHCTSTRRRCARVAGQIPCGCTTPTRSPPMRLGDALLLVVAHA